MKIFFDTEFTGLHKNTTLISIGLVAENGKKFYAELTDYDETQCDKWITENVLDHLLLSGNEAEKDRLYNDADVTTVLGCKGDVRAELLDWIKSICGAENVQFVSDVCHYDMVLLIDLLGDSVWELPEIINPVCHDISQDIAMILDIDERRAFDYSREQLLTERGIALPNGGKHNALYDAEVIKAIYEDFFSVGGVNKEDKNG